MLKVGFQLDDSENGLLKKGFFDKISRHWRGGCLEYQVGSNLEMANQKKTHHQTPKKTLTEMFSKIDYYHPEIRCGFSVYKTTSFPKISCCANSSCIPKPDLGLGTLGTVIPWTHHHPEPMKFAPEKGFL